MRNIQLTDFEEDESSDAIANKYIMAIVDEDDRELFLAVHRATPNFPLDGEEAQRKADNMDALYRLLSELSDWQDATSDQIFSPDGAHALKSLITTFKAIH